MRRAFGDLSLLGIAAGLLFAYGIQTRHGPALADEFIYLAGAQHFAEKGRLDARYYDGDAILQVGHPHHDVHTPGYVILLGALSALTGGGYWTAVALNVAAYLGSAFLVGALARALGVAPPGAWAASGVFLVLPASLAYVFWAMPELVLTALLLASLVIAARWGDRRAGAIGAALVFGLAVLVRESALLALPVPLALLLGRGRVRVFLAVTLGFLVLVYAPLSRHRAPGGANFWAPTSGRAFGYEAVQAAREGRIGRAVELAWARARTNVEDLAIRAPWTERGFLLVFLALPAIALARWKRLEKRERRVVACLSLSFGVLLVLLVFVYLLAQWSGFRYLMFLMPAFLPWLGDSSPRGWVPAALVGGVCLALVVGTWQISTEYKVSRQRRQEGITAYVEQYLDPRAVDRVVLPNGWLFGLKHYPVEVVSSLPSTGGAGLRDLERAVGFDVLVLPGNSPLAAELEGRPRYQKINAADPDPPLHVYRRVR